MATPSTSVPPFPSRTSQEPASEAVDPARPLQVAICLYRFPVASETFVNTQIEGLVQRGAIVDVVCQSREPGLESLPEELGVREVRIAPTVPLNWVKRGFRAIGIAAQVGRRDPRVLLNALNFLRWGRAAGSLKLLFGSLPYLDRSYDVVHCHFGPAGLNATLLREIGAITGAVTTVFHGWDISQAIDVRGPHFYDPLFRHGDLLLPVSNQWRDRLIELGADPARTTVHHMGVAMPDSLPERTSTDGPVRLLSVCRLVEKKGIEFGIRALAALGSTAAWEYRIIGEGPEQERLESVAAECGLSDRIRFEGWKEPDEVAAAMDAADIFMAPSVTADNGDQEGIPVGIMEAMAHALPIISSFHTGIPELVDDAVTGLLAPERDIRQLTEHLRALLSDPERRGAMGRAGRARVAAEYDIEQLNDALLRRFHVLVAARASTA